MNAFESHLSSITGINDLRLPNQENIGGLLRHSTKCCATGTCDSVAFTKKNNRNQILSNEIKQNVHIEEQQPSLCNLLIQYGPLI